MLKMVDFMYILPHWEKIKENSIWGKVEGIEQKRIQLTPGWSCVSGKEM